MERAANRKMFSTISCGRSHKDFPFRRGCRWLCSRTNHRRRLLPRCWPLEHSRTALKASLIAGGYL